VDVASHNVIASEVLQLQQSGDNTIGGRTDVRLNKNRENEYENTKYNYMFPVSRVGGGRINNR
jgi:hypothetical protein